MKKNPKGPLEPRVYLPSKSHQDYSKEESDYSSRYVVEKFFSKNQSTWDKHLGASYLLDQIAQGLQKHGGRFESFSEEKDKFVIEALKLFGEPFWRGTYEDPLKLSEEDTQLTVAVCRVFGRLQRQIVFGDTKERHKAVKRLRRITTAFIPETRGKKKVTVHPIEVHAVYYKELFRLYHVQNALKSHAGGRSRSQKVRAVSKNFDITIEQIRELWKLDEDDKPTVRPISIKEMARVLTARYFGMTQHRISNILAS